MDRGHKSLPMEIFIKENMQRESPMVMVSIIGQMEVTSKGPLETVWDKVTVCGKKDLETAINTKASTLKIKSMATAYLLGLVAMYIREIIKSSFETTSDRCIGVMVVITKDNGWMVFSMEKESYMFQTKELRKVFLRIIC